MKFNLDLVDSLNTEIIDEAVVSIQILLTALANDEAFSDKMMLAFGSLIDVEKVEELRQQLTAGNFEGLPKIEIRPADEINGANGAFSKDTNTIYLSREYLSQNSINPNAVANVLLEEIGHFVDAQINSSDAYGDEGAIFSALAQGVPIDEPALQALKAENDTAIITLDRQFVAIEQSEGFNALLWPLFPRWTSNTITYNFMPAIPEVYLVANLNSMFPADLVLDGAIPDPFSFKAFDNLQKLAAEEAMKLWAEVADIRFVRKEDSILQLSNYVTLGALQPVLEKFGKWSDFTNKLTNFIVST